MIVHDCRNVPIKTRSHTMYPNRHGSRPSCVLGRRHCINYYGQTQTHVITHDAKTHLGIDGGRTRRSVCFSVARSSCSQRHIKVSLRDHGAWPASSSQFCGHTCVPFAPPDVSGPPTNEMFGQTPYERATYGYARSARPFIILTNGAHSSESLR